MRGRSAQTGSSTSQPSTRTSPTIRPPSSSTTGGSSGSRRGEILHLRRADVVPESAEIQFEGSTGVVDGKRIDGSTKGGRSRVVGIDQGTMRMLEKRRLAQEADRALAGPEWV